MSVKAKYIKDLPLKNELDGSESLLVQDSNGTKQAPLGIIVDEIEQNSQEKIREIESELAQTNAQLLKKANDHEVVKKGHGTLNDFDEETRGILQGLNSGEINAVLGDGNVVNRNYADNSITLNKLSETVLAKYDGFINTMDEDGYVELNIDKFERTCIKDHSNISNFKGCAFPFVFTKEFSHILIPRIEIVSDTASVLKLFISTKSGIVGKWHYRINPITSKEILLPSGVHENLLVDLNFDYSSMNKGEVYYLGFYSPQQVSEQTYSTINNIKYVHCNDVNLVSDFVYGKGVDSEYELLYLMHYGSYQWSKVSSGQEPFLIPNFLFSNGDMYRFSFPDVYTKEEVDTIINPEKLNEYDTILESLKNQGVYSIDDNKLVKTYSDDSTNIQNLKGYAFPFVYTGEKFTTLRIDSLEVEEDCQIKFFISEFSGIKGLWHYKGNYLTSFTLDFKQGLHNELLIDPRFDFSLLTKDKIYYLGFYSPQDVVEPSYSAINTIRVKTLNNNQKGELLYDADFNGTLKPLYLMHYGTYTWDYSTEGSNYKIVPRLAISYQNPYVLDVEGYLIDKGVEINTGGKKVINFLGDSITFGVDGSLGGNACENPYPKLVSKILGATTNNYGIPGSTIAGDGSTQGEHNILGYQPMNDRYTYMGEADYVIVFGGVNDYGADRIIPLGSYGDSTNLTFYGALKILIEGLIEKYPNSRIGFITPLKKMDDTKPNIYGHKLSEYVEAIRIMCEEYSVPVLDFYKNGGAYPNNYNWRKINMTDGLHPNQVFYEKMAVQISSFIKSL